jgi:hypothetical protein
MRLIRKLLLVALRFFARFNMVRNIVIWSIRERTQVHSNEILSNAVDFTKQEDHILSDLNQDGYSVGINLTKEACKRIDEYCRRQEFLANKTKKIVSFDNFELDESYIYRRINPHLDCEIISSITKDARILKIVKAYLGVQPILHNTQIWYSYPPKNQLENINNPDYGFHYDIDDVKFVKLFFYLTDVDESSGAHMAIPGTHRDFSIRKKLNRRIRGEIPAVYRSEHIFIGETGTGFVEDTNIYHKGSMPQKPRLIMQIEYSATSIFSKLENSIK